MSGARTYSSAPALNVKFLTPGRVMARRRPCPGPEPPSFDPGAHEALDELALEKKEGDQKRPGSHQRGGRDDRPVDALAGRGEDAEAHGERAGLDRYTLQSGIEPVGG